MRGQDDVGRVGLGHHGFEKRSRRLARADDPWVGGKAVSPRHLRRLPGPLDEEETGGVDLVDLLHGHEEKGGRSIVAGARALERGREKGEREREKVSFLFASFSGRSAKKKKKHSLPLPFAATKETLAFSFLRE